jgi:4-amino-4-deoxy-L-arabinose transferase-like glycosyltransferase
MENSLPTHPQPAASRWPLSRASTVRLALLALIVALAFGLRVYAVGWGLPYVDHPDEPSAANKVLNMIRRGDWNPHFFEKPSLYYYLLRIDFAAHLRYGFAAGLYQSMDDLPQTTDRFLTTPQLYIWGRMLSTILGAATVAVLYLVGRRWWGERVGIVSAALLAVSSFHMRESQYITVDVTTALVTLLALATAMRLLDHTGWRDYALAGIACGLAASAKYNAGAVALSIAVAHALMWGRASLRQSGRLAWAGLWSLLGFLATTPYAALTFSDFVAGIARQAGTYSPSGATSQRWPIAGYARFFWDDGLQPLPLLAALAGVALVLARRDRPALVMLAFVPTQIVFFLAQNRHFDRNLLPVIPPLLICAAIALEAGTAAIGKQLRPSQPLSQPGRVGRGVKETLALTVLTAAVAAGSLLDAVTLTRFEAMPHSKVRAGAYVRDSLPHGAPIAVALHPTQWAGQPLITPLDDVAQHDAGWYRAQGYRYLIANAKDTDAAHYQPLRAAGQVLEVFAGDHEGMPGPRMEALDLGDHPERLAIERRPAEFGSKLALLGFQRSAGDLRTGFSPLDGAEAAPGQVLQINMYWRALAKIDADYAIYLHLLDKNGQKVAQRDTVIRAADYPTSRWQPGELAVDLADLPLPAGLASGVYRLELGVYRMDTFERLALAANPEGGLELMTVTVR